MKKATCAFVLALLMIPGVFVGFLFWGALGDGGSEKSRKPCSPLWRSGRWHRG